MSIDSNVEPLVRRILDAVVKSNEDEFDASLSALPDKFRADALELTVAICAYTLFDAYEGRLTPEDLQLVAATVARMESWVRLTPQEVAETWGLDLEQIVVAARHAGRT